MPAIGVDPRVPFVKARRHLKEEAAWRLVPALLLTALAGAQAQTTRLDLLERLQTEVASAPPSALGARSERLTSISDLYAGRGQAAAAIFWAKQAALLERGAANVGAPSAAAPPAPCSHDHLASLLLAAERLDEAQQVLQRAKECELQQELGASLPSDPRTTPMPLSRVENDLADASAELDREWERLALARSELMARPTIAESATRAELANVNSRIGEVEQRRQDVFALVEHRLRGAGQASTVPSRLQVAITGLAQVEPGAQAVGLQYVVQDGGLWILLVRQGQPPSRIFVVVPRRQLEEATQLLRLLVRDPSSSLERVQAQLELLYQWLVLPVEAQLSQAKTLMVSTSGSLRYVPFAALRQHGSYLVERFAVASFNEAVEPHLDHRAPAHWRIIAMGMSQPVEKLRALVAVREETRGILAQPNTQGVAYLDRDFTLLRLQSVLAPSNGPNVLHIASHFVLEPRRAADSRLYLGDGSRLSLPDLAGGRLRFDQLDLLTLSACETAAPGQTDSATGQEIESLGAYAQQQGARAVVATLWKVNDRSTAAFMQGFYHQRGSLQSDKASALRDTQLAFVRRRGVEGGASPDWSHPFHWAPFVLMGNWR